MITASVRGIGFLFKLKFHKKLSFWTPQVYIKA